MKDKVAPDYSEYASAPLLDDTRLSATTWTVAKKSIDDERKAKAQASSGPAKDR